MTAVAAALLWVAIFIADRAFKPALAAFSPALFWAYDCSIFVAGPLAVLAVARRFAGLGPGEYGLIGRDRSLTLGSIGYLSLLCWLGLAAVVFVAEQLAAAVLPAIGFGWGPAFDLGELIPTGPARVAVVVYLSLTAGIAEELMFRGLALALVERAPLSPVARTASFLAISTVVFAAAHWEQGGIGLAASAAYGLAAGLVYARLRVLWPLIVAHVGVDLAWFW